LNSCLPRNGRWVRYGKKIDTEEGQRKFAQPFRPLLLGVGVDDGGYGLAPLVLIRRFLTLDLAMARKA
jgi:hypothetical protein